MLISNVLLWHNWKNTYNFTTNIDIEFYEKIVKEKSQINMFEMSLNNKQNNYF